MNVVDVIFTATLARHASPVLAALRDRDAVELAEKRYDLAADALNAGNYAKTRYYGLWADRAVSGR